MTKAKQRNMILCVFSALFLCVAIALSWVYSATAYAAEDGDTEYSGVLEDLRKDSSLSESYYPTVTDDYFLQIIQIAESSDKELFVYVYQPSGQARDFRASSINISNTINDEISYRNYKLRYLNSSGVFYKYLVENLTVSTAETRYYAISSIYRPFDETIDEGAEHGNTVTEVNYAVEKQYCFSNINGQPYCSVVDIETIEITDKFVGFVRYSDGFKLYVGSCDSHFVAFNTDRPIDRLLEADVYYTTQDYSWSFVTFVGENETFGEKKDNYAYLTYTDRVEHTGDGLFAGTYTWDRMETVEQFLEENNGYQNLYSGALIDVNVANAITEEGKAALESKQWILRFAETSYSLSGGYGSTTSFSTIVGDVTILRLKFETDGITYNLGVIDNKQSGSSEPINQETVEVGLSDTGKIILSVLLLILLLVILWPILPFIIQAVIGVITMPFKAIGAAGKSLKERRKEKKARKQSKKPPDGADDTEV